MSSLAPGRSPATASPVSDLNGHAAVSTQQAARGFERQISAEPIREACGEAASGEESW